ncbi:hypothetical protein AB0A95_33420 [Micromonospora sp. NPDC049230]|uniref:hypothetical protein n=1 Tax=Micromonospora sp. NPDC049230 TaxID=3155502 RepID=UPI0033FC591A
MTVLDGPPVRVVLDLSALRAYVAGSVHVGETIHEVVEDGRFGVPVLAACEALVLVSGKDLAMLHRLLALQRCALLAELPEDLVDLTYWRRVTGRADLAAAAVVALTYDAPVLTSEGARYGDDVPVLHFPA